MNKAHKTTVLSVVFASFTQLSAFANPIVVPFDPEYEPLSFRSETGMPTGFDVDVARALALEANIEIEFAASEFFEIQNGGWPGNWGYTVASMSRDPDREAKFNFIGPYVFDTVVVVSRITNTTTRVSELSDVEIGVCSGCVYEDFLNGLASGIEGLPIPDAKPVTFATDPDILREVTNPNSTLEFGVTSAFHADYYIELGAPLKKLDPPLFFSPLWIVVPKERSDLSQRLSAAFDTLLRTGKLRELSIQYLGQDYTEFAQ